MKKYIIIIVIVLLLISSLIYFLCNKKNEKVKINSISSFSFFYTQGYAMNSDIRYEIDCKDDCIAIIKPYGKSDEEAKEVKLDDAMISKIIDLFNKYDVIKWNGFNKSDSGVLDGDSFSFYLTYDVDKKVSSSGYMRWPDNYKELRDELDNIFNSLMEEENDRD